jgi:hypothetical protein
MWHLIRVAAALGDNMHTPYDDMGRSLVDHRGPHVRTMTCGRNGSRRLAALAESRYPDPFRNMGKLGTLLDLTCEQAAYQLIAIRTVSPNLAGYSGL